MENQNLEHITGHRLTEIAERLAVSKEYVRLVINGDRERNTPTAKKIIEAAEILNTSIRNGLEGVDKLLIAEEEK